MVFSTSIRIPLPDSMRKTGRRLRLPLLLAALALLTAPISGQREAERTEVRALWVVRTTLSSPASIDTMVKAAQAAGFNTLLVQVRGRADAYYAGGVEPRPAAIAAQRGFDPLATTITRAHAVGLRVHAWINLNLVAGVGELPPARDHIVYRHPEWLMVPRALAPELVSMNSTSSQYLSRLTRHARGRSVEVEGLYLSPIPTASVHYTTSVVRDIVRRYEVDGVHLDYVRYPSDDFDYSREALTVYRRSVIPDLTPAQRTRYDQRLAAEPLIYTQAFPERWRRFRADRLTELVSSVRAAVKTARSSVVLSAAVKPDAANAEARHLQPWSTWIEQGLIDVVCPMAYTTDPSEFAAQISTALAVAGHGSLWAGIGAYRLSQRQIVENVQHARRLNADGVILFSYDSLTGPKRGPAYLAEIGRAAFLQ
jgi:uncharacterized lipoprotein YddW (UPF0748 family)